MKSELTRPIAVDLFAGAGGMSLGLEQAGFDVAAAVEYDAVHAATHHFNFPESATICAPVQQVTGAQILEAAGLGTTQVDLVAGGPPCQGFSMIGKRVASDARNNLVFEFHRIVAELNSRYFVMENVPGMKSGEQAQILKELIYRFEQSGYICQNVQLLTASQFGVPQKRTRLFLVGCRQGEALPNEILPITSMDRIAHELPRTPTVGDALLDLPNADFYDDLLHSDEALADFGPPSEYAAILRGIVRESSDYGYRRTGSTSGTVTSSRRTVHTEVSVERFAATVPGSVERISRFLRLDPDGYSNTLRAGTDSKRGAHTSPRPIHPLYPRVITVREAARLHSMPDWFRLHSTKWHGFRQVGNAVAPRVGRVVGTSVIEAMNRTPVRPRKSIKLGDRSLLQMNMGEACDYFGLDRDVIGHRDRK